MIYVFNVDGVLCESKTEIDKEMGELLDELSQHHTIVFLTGGKFDQVSSQVLPNTQNLKRPFYILPLSGADGWKLDTTENIQLWHNNLTLDEKGRIIAGIINVLSTIPRSPIVWGDTIDDRESQITLSLLGVAAPWNIKKYYDPDRKFRNELVWRLVNRIIGAKDFDFRIGGSTSIDITKKGLNKGDNLSHLTSLNNWKMDEIVFIGDNLQPGGNDFPVKQAGFFCIEVKNIDETKAHIKTWLTR